MIAPVGRLPKQEIIWLGRHKCKHRHTFLEHYECYMRENPHGERLGFFDIETSGLQATFGILLCYAIRDHSSKRMYEGVITAKDLHSNGTLDKRVVKKCVEDLSQFDKVVTYYGTGFDLPFIRTRALAHGLEFLGYGELLHHDLYYLVKARLRLHRNRLETACEAILGKTRKTPIKASYWIQALQGDAGSLRFIQDHCRKDVLDLEDLYGRLVGFAATQRRSI